MRIFIPAATTLVLALGTPGIAQQQPTQESLEQLTLEVRQLASSLQSTQSDLREARQEIQTLRGQMEQMRAASTPAPATAETALSTRVDNLEESQRISESRIEQHQQIKVESASKYSVKLTGMVLFNAGMNRGEVNNQDNPMLATGSAPRETQGSIFGTFRQTLLGLQLFGPKVANARTMADVQFDFFGGATPTLDGSAMGVMRLRTARVQFDWPRWSLSFAQDQPFISPNSPSSLASIGTPALGYSGNLWTWTPQIVATRSWNTGERDRVELQFGVLDPFNGELPPRFTTDREPEAGERSRTPAFAVHPTWRHGEDDRVTSIGAGGYFARQDYGYGRVVDAWAATLDWSIPVTRMLSLSGEFFRGQALGGFWGGIGQSVAYSERGPYSPVRGINTVGGWSQIKLRPSQQWEFNGAYGQDNPFAKDLRMGVYSSDNSYAPVVRNWTTMVNVIQRPRSNLLLSLEYRHLNTVWLSGSKRTAEHVNLGVGLQF